MRVQAGVERLLKVQEITEGTGWGREDKLLRV